MEVDEFAAITLATSGNVVRPMRQVSTPSMGVLVELPSWTTWIFGCNRLSCPMTRSNKGKHFVARPVLVTKSGSKPL
jgi:hypothetical protein